MTTGRCKGRWEKGEEEREEGEKR